MASELDFTTLARAAARLKTSTSDAELPALITAASQALADWLGYDAHLRENIQETVPSEGGRVLFLRAGAVRRIVSVTVAGAEVPPSEYFLESPRYGRVLNRRGGWPFTGQWTDGVAPMPLRAHDTGEIVVTYDAGWRTPGQVALALAADPASTLTSDLPAPLEEAALITLTALRSGAGRDPTVISRSIGGGSVTWAADRTAVPALAQQLARPHHKSTRRKQT
ncbi:hypothetical protein JQX13_38895 [Archangium violaceum]|uniref:hypothetical protein n=1 Tax=Archangium violaceum TaxID=83451 RepID=UPI00193C372E|nr:hypothetical protein [Archangium violaceum]QRK06051.1 hypothetical protein JQX13_38895 [Archangium violaceum]